ncbi:MAG: DNA polymerase Y family protein [Pseudomonadales bacterium]|nr:DNA polymerase Y family protein [Pseudomonadales bacterium]
MANPRQAQLALALAPPPPKKPPAAAYKVSSSNPAPSSSKQLWLCIYFPYLALEVIAQRADFQSIHNPQKPLAITEEIKGRPHILMASRSALAAGVTAGLSTASALALCPELTLCPRQPEEEQQTLQALAQWSYQFTPCLSLEFPQALLLEVKSSLLLFGGLDNLSQYILEGCQQRGYRPCLTVTPSPKASWVLARAGGNIQINQIDALRSTLGQLPLSSLDLPPRTLQRLHKTGLTNLRDLWRLPRADLARRYGQDLLKILDQMSASQHQLLTTFEQPLTFSTEQDLPIAMENWKLFWPAIQHQLETLIRFLHNRNAATAHLELSFFHAYGARSELMISLRTPSQSLANLMLLVRERLDHYTLPASVITVQLCTHAIEPYRTQERDLFQPNSTHKIDENWANLLDQLQARLGPNSIQTLQLNEDHRPECAQHYIRYDGVELKPSKASTPQTTTKLRPYWLLPQPRALRLCDYTIDPQSERIESGWWDQHPIRRDYHTAIDRNGSRCWVFQDLRQPKRWYLQGFFG